MKPVVSASMMCADQLNLARDIVELEQAGVDYLHLDIMDGNYVHNIALGIGVCNDIMATSPLPADIHLLVLHPEKYLNALRFGEGDIVSGHIECFEDLRGFSRQVRARGAKCGTVLNRGIDVDAVAPFLDELDVISLMMIEPGFSGLKLLDGSIEKIGRMRAFLDSEGRASLPIEVDGNVSFENASSMREMGADCFVAGSSSVFGGEGGIGPSLERLRKKLVV